MEPWMQQAKQQMNQMKKHHTEDCLDANDDTSPLKGRCICPTTLAEVRARNKASGGHWFCPETMRFWHSKIHGGVRRGKYFITSEDNYNRTQRLFTVRTFNADGGINTVGKFQAYVSLDEAKEAVRKIVTEGK